MDELVAGDIAVIKTVFLCIFVGEKAKQRI